MEKIFIHNTEEKRIIRFTEKHFSHRVNTPVNVRNVLSVYKDILHDDEIGGPLVDNTILYCICFEFEKNNKYWVYESKHFRDRDYTIILHTFSEEIT